MSARPWIADIAKVHVLARSTGRELVQIRFPYHHRACCREALYDNRIRGRYAPLEETGADGRPHPTGVDAILAGVRNSVQRTAIAAFGEFPIQNSRLYESSVAGFRDEGFGVPLHRVEPVDRSADDLEARGLALAQCL